ncbi:hypothetical protein AVEN_91888-1 [Araneus ventricosus]|uniref:Uncharacterized protein n=1 Tax=Araneus ventricosus TaxID=182803 RepID=A0A4Y2NSU2_ARAVE|nr:hypothetical protein AVEN_91888-1 [Araneus ventricosus]
MLDSETIVKELLGQIRLAPLPEGQQGPPPMPIEERPEQQAGQRPALGQGDGPPQPPRMEAPQGQQG